MGLTILGGGSWGLRGGWGCVGRFSDEEASLWWYAYARKGQRLGQGERRASHPHAGK
jgi:hypothetical protein